MSLVFEMCKFDDFFYLFIPNLTSKNSNLIFRIGLRGVIVDMAIRMHNYFVPIQPPMVQLKIRYRPEEAATAINDNL